MESYSVRDVERVLHLSRGTLRGLIATGFVKPTRGPRRELRFSFQDLIVLRAARALIDAKVSRRRISRSLEDLRRHLPDALPLSGLSIRAIGDRVVVRDGKSHWQVDDGQYVLGFDVSVEDGELRVVEPGQQATADATATVTADAGAAETSDADDLFSQALQIEEQDPRAAEKVYERVLGTDPENVSAWINWGRLLHERGATGQAEKVYRRGQQQCGRDPLLMFNLGVLLDDLGRTIAAIEAYQAAIGEDPSLADCHFNLARLYESLGQTQHAIRHLGQYRRLLTADNS
ncbi:MAG: tetratricopeptide repeat protein [Gammaproteobacteria bacterium]|nr:tetratricopeptide repeat protein [Gammaproteobacteria bacterium]